MASSNQNLDSLGRDIQNVVDQAVNSRDYQQLNQTVRQVVEQVVDTGSEEGQKEFAEWKAKKEDVDHEVTGLLFMIVKNGKPSSSIY